MFIMNILKRELTPILLRDPPLHTLEMLSPAEHTMLQETLTAGVKSLLYFDQRADRVAGERRVMTGLRSYPPTVS